MEKNKKNIDIIELMETDLYDLNLQYGTVCCLKDAGLQRIIDVLRYRNEDVVHNNLKNIRLFGKTKEKYLNSRLLEYGINYNDNKQRQELIEEYDAQKLLSNNKPPEVELDNMNKVGMKTKTDNIGIVELLDTVIEDFDFSERTFNCLKRAGINTAYDVVKKEDLRQIRNFGAKRFEELKQKFIGYGIDLEDRAQCDELIKKYDNITNNQEDKRISAWEQQLELEKSNDILEEKLESKQDTLLGLKQQLERRKYLEQKLIECDKEFKRLMRLYNSLNSKESSNNHGTK